MLNAALEAFPLGLAIAEKGRILYANRGFAQRFGVSQELDIQGRYLEASVAELRRVKRGNSYLIISTRAGASFRGRIRVEGRICKSSANHHKSKEFMNRYKMEAIGRLVSGVAHDFNNLLTGIMLYCDLLLAGLKDNRMRHHAEEIRMAGEHGAALIQQLMAVARQETIEPRLLSWNQAILDIRNLLGRLIGENIEFVFDPAEGLAFGEDGSRAGPPDHSQSGAQCPRCHAGGRTDYAQHPQRS